VGIAAAVAALAPNAATAIAAADWFKISRRFICGSYRRRIDESRIGLEPI
jgi:hypothetical protein